MDMYLWSEQVWLIWFLICRRIFTLHGLQKENEETLTFSFLSLYFLSDDRFI